MDTTLSPIAVAAPNTRIFVSGLRPGVQVGELRNAFAEFGSLASVEIVNYADGQSKGSQKRKREPFAFVTFESEAVAREVVSKHEEECQSKVINNSATSTSTSTESKTPSETPLYTIVQTSNPIVPRFAKRLKKSMNEQEQILDLVQRKETDAPNMLLQVHSSHLDRMIQYVADLKKEENAHPFKVPEYIGSSSSKSNNISFVFLNINIKAIAMAMPTSTKSEVQPGSDCSRTYWYRHIIANPIIARFGIRKMYAVDRLVRVPPTEQEDDKRANLLVNTALDILEESIGKECRNDIILKAQAFPPKKGNLQQHIVACLDKRMNDIESISNTDADAESKFTNLRKVHLTMATTNYTHLFSSVQVFTPQTHAQNMKASDKRTVDELFMVGVPLMSLETDASDINTNSPKMENVQSDDNDNDNDNENDEICRAYFKLKEVMDNYRRDEPTEKASLSFHGKAAFDCGSSPGGWTKYLLQDEGCKTVYSCDPGLLDESVKAMEGTRHLQMRGTDAIDMLREEGCADVSLWVSDMCLVDPKQQVGHLVEAKEKGILAPNAFFVLTLKFNTGHSKDTFDLFARQELKRLQGLVNVKSVQMYHLFSNRKGERTLIGRLE